jgi:tRNA A37 threonylcarbamoyladenosine dehydratase
MNRFARTELLIGREGLARLARTHVAVIGLGAVGSYSVEGLVRAGIGRLTVVDFDEIRASNINRQLYALESTLGRRKVDVAVERVRDINPDCRVEGLPLFMDAETVQEVIRRSPDFVVDAIDSVGPKVQVLIAMARAGIRTISCMGAATRTEASLVRVGDLSETENCPLARQVRRGLRKNGITRGIRCVYSTERASAAGACETDDEQSLSRGRKRRSLGSLSCVTGVFGLTAAGEVIANAAGMRCNDHEHWQAD